MKRKVGITEVVLRDGNQSLLATRVRTDDMLPVLEQIDAIGYWSVESWGGATYDACLRFLGEDPWERLRTFKKHMPNTKQQMLLRGKNLLGYRHYSDSIIGKFVDHATKNGIDVFRVFDALNDINNLDTVLKAVKSSGAHAQATLSYTISPLHNQNTWLDLAKRFADLEVDSIAIKDMSGLLRPYVAYELVSKLKEQLPDMPLHLHCHATTGLSTATAIKAIEAGLDNIDTSISTLSMTYGHSATEALVACLENSDYDTGIDLEKLEPIAEHFREIRSVYGQFEGTMKGVDARILKAQVPGGMMSNLENQLRGQGALDKLADVLKEVEVVRKDLGYVPLVTPSSQIVGTQSVLNVLSGKRYSSITNETKGVVTGAYGKTPGKVSAELRKLCEGDATAQDKQDKQDKNQDTLHNQTENLKMELTDKTAHSKETLYEHSFSYAMFGHVALKFLNAQGDKQQFELKPAKASKTSDGEYTVEYEGKSWDVKVAKGVIASATATHASQTNQPNGMQPQPQSQVQQQPTTANTQQLGSPMAGVILKVLVQPGAQVKAGEDIFMLESMKMELPIKAEQNLTVVQVQVTPTTEVSQGQVLLSYTS